VKAAHGFTLLEVMIAVSIAAVGIVALLELFGGSMHLARAATEQTRAIVVASSVMDQALWRAELPERDYEGDEGDYHWTMSIKAVDPTLGSTEDEPLEDVSDDYELYEVVVHVQWGSGETPKTISLRSLRVMEKF
jgi:prepilin-type N-terminal cleavage/methylation domain-containing protein